MTCGNENHSVADSLVDYCAGTLDKAAAAAVETHLRECHSCEELVIAQRAALSVLDEWGAPAVSEDFDTRLYRRIEAEKQGGWAQRFWNGLRASGVSTMWKPAIPIGAAAAALTVGLLLHTPSSPVLSAVPVAGTAPVVTIEPVSTSATVDADQLESALDDLDMLTPMPRKGAI